MIERKFEIVEVDSPDRCGASIGKGQCRYKSTEHSQYCAMHGGHIAERQHSEKVKRQYQLGKWQATVDGFADDDEVKSLRGEIGITRMLMQEIVLKCKDSNQLVMYAGKISDLVQKLERLVVSCNRLETSMGQSLDKSKVLELGAQFVEIISRYVQDEDTLSSIGDDIITLINTTGTMK